ncbi:M20 family metallo-hydrolase [Nocardiopsis sp. JB363]|uniref:M20 family metallo-hydrolase n=1 Tax=Nocardiopsis sp. JB363 TaxID=1434837 RepID=UPI00097A9A32|nr:M20 family metallo-hydrolase [Nocardiopsis sp. JB363]SIO90227.1 N-carbamoyl-L-amino acid hydrolase [Nocardiopsis sp. JB363]
MNSDDTRFLADFEAMGTFGATPAGGVDRQAATEPDLAQRGWLRDLLTDHGMRVVHDRIGNQFGLVERVPGAPYVVVGSHMDSQPTAGRFDGAYGVLAALHAVSRAARADTAEGADPAYNLAVVNWFNEEGSRFPPSMMGSAVYTGRLPLETALAVRDRAGVSVAEALAGTGFLGEGEGPEAAFCAEIHVEQGRVLEESGATIGLVEATWAARKYRVVVSGEQAHSGAAVMADRRDALLGASMLVVAARDLADRFPGVLHTAVGSMDVYPNSPVVVASRAELLLDLRSNDEEVLAEADRLLREHVTRVEESASVSVELEQSHAWGVDPFQPEGVELARAGAEKLGLSHRRVRTVAGHDSVNMKNRVPTVMLFVPSVEGISHNEAEYTTDADLVSGLDVLTEVVRRLGRGELPSTGVHDPAARD